MALDRQIAVLIDWSIAERYEQITMSNTQEAGGTEVPSHRACAHCRSQKVRCIIDEDGSESCQRCAKAGRPCVFTPLQKRKQRKRTDTRVAELEREMRAMRAALKNHESTKNSERRVERQQQNAPEGLWFVENNLDAPRIANDTVPAAAYPSTVTGNRGFVTRPTQRNGPTGLAKRFVDRPLTDSKDVVDSGMISMATARQLFESYRKHLIPHYPVVPIPESTTADELRQVKPTLFLAIIAAAAGTENPELSAMLDREVLHTYATKSLVHSEKSLEMVQALLISAVWYHPPNKFGQLKYYEYIHMAATMALDIGIGARRTTRRSRFGSRESNQLQVGRPNVHPLEDTANPDLSLTPRSSDHSPETTSIESRRTFLACYVVCAGVSMALRRPNMIRANTYVSECLEFLERSSEALHSDRTLVAWSKLIMIGDEISISFCYDDPGGVASISELRTQLMIKDFNAKLESWFTNVPDADMTHTLHMMYHAIRLLLFEVSLHVDHSPEDFKAPYQMGGIHPMEGDIPTQALAEAIAESITASHQLLSIFLSMDVDAARALPVFGYVRVSYAAFVLTKLCLSNSSPASRTGKLIDRSSLKAESFMDRAILHVRAVVGPVRCRVPAIFLALLFKLRQWCMNPALIEKSDEITTKPALDPSQAVTPEEESHDQQKNRAMYIEGPRIVDHVSSNENSPQTSSEPSINTSISTPKSQIFDQTTAPIGIPSAPTTNMISSETSSSSNPAVPQTMPYLDPNDQMELDQNFFMFFGDINNYTDSTQDLHDWASVPPDLMTLPDNFTWPGSSMIDATTL